MEGAALLVSTADLIIKIGELVIQHLHALFGSGDPEQNHAKDRLQILFFDRPLFSTLPDSYVPGSRVDWKALEGFVREAVYIRDHTEGVDPQALPWLVAKFSQWYEGLNDHHKSILRDEIDNLSRSSAVDT